MKKLLVLSIAIVVLVLSYVFYSTGDNTSTVKIVETTVTSTTLVVVPATTIPATSTSTTSTTLPRVSGGTKSVQTTVKPSKVSLSELPINPPTPTGATLVEDDWGSPGSFKMIWEVSAATFSASRAPVLDYVRSKGCTITDTDSGTFRCGNGVTGYASLNGSMDASAPDKVILHYSVTW
jgi:hypothetical protein